MFCLYVFKIVFLETEKYRLRYENRRSQQNEDYERIRVDYDNQIGDLNEALKAKDSQLAVLRVRIQEADGQLKEKTDQLQGIQSQNEQSVLKFNGPNVRYSISVLIVFGLRG